MKPKLLLRIAAVTMLLHTIGHTIGTLSWKKNPDAAAQQVINDMMTHKFIFMGSMRGMGDYYEGFALTMIFMLLLITTLLWLISDISTLHPVSASRILIPITFSLLAMALIEFWYFFPLAGWLSLIAGILSGWSFLTILKNKTMK